MKRLPVLIAALSAALLAQTSNKPERIEWFRDQGLGLFIHWSLDSQLGSVISHSMAGASGDYLKRFITELPKTFNPRKFHPQDWAALAKLAGMRYVVFTTKHHSGFCMWHTRTTPFRIDNTPFPRDITREVLDAFREQGIAAGIYFSPDDFHWLHNHGVIIDRNRKEVYPANNPGLMQLNQAQVRELMTGYGPIDVLFIDGPPEGLKDLAWKLNPDLVITRGEITTPEQYVPGVPLEGAWEACITMGQGWQYHGRNEQYKSGWDLISLLVETRARGGNLLLNVGPKPDGELPIEQEERLRELALWMFVNGEAIYGTRTWVVTNEGDNWFTKKKDEDTLYAIVKTRERWPFGAWRDLVIKSAKAGPDTQVSVLGQSDQVLEYQASVIPKTTWKQEPDGLHVRAMRAQRLLNNRRWPNPVVFKLTNVKPALTPPRVVTGTAARGAGGGVTLTATLETLGDAAAVEVGFEYRSLRGLDANERAGEWTATPLQRRTAAGGFTATVSGWTPGDPYEFRAVVRHPMLTLFGEGKRVTPR